MATPTKQDERKGWGAFLIQAIYASVAAGGERASIWSVARPLLPLYLLLFSIQSGWLFWITYQNTVAEHPGRSLEFIAFATLGGVNTHGLGAAMSSMIVTEGVSVLMVMYGLGMNLIVQPIIRLHENRGKEKGIAIGREEGKEEGIAIGEERGIAIGEERGRQEAKEEGIAIGEERGRQEAAETHQKWQAWYQRGLDAAARGETFNEPPPAPPGQKKD